MTTENIIKISLNYGDFECLVRGGILSIKDKKVLIQIILQDIGFHNMDEAITKADNGIDIYKGLERDNWIKLHIGKINNPEYPNNFYFGTITHWIPLPEPPN